MRAGQVPWITPGTGKTRVLATAARIWDGPVIGTATSQNATNGLRAAGIAAAVNTTRLLADIAAGRIPPGSLILADEASMISLPHLAAITAYAARHSCKLVLAGDQEQLAAVEGGGAMMLLADQLGYVQLAEPVRFTAPWERAASLRLRHGDATALDDYDQHGRIQGAPPDHAIDQAARAYVAAYLDGRDVLLMAADWARCRELSARIRDDLIHLGLVSDGPAVRIADGAQASPGDLIICRANDHTLQAGEPGRMLANGDILRIEAITGDGLTVRRLLGTDPHTGQRRFTAQAFRYHGYQTANLAYAITGHSAQGATVHTGIALVTGTEDRQWLYPALTRGTDANLAFVFTTPARPADPQPGIRPAPELGRYDRLRRHRTGHPAALPTPRRPAARTRASRSPSSPTSSPATAPNCPPPPPGSATSPTPTTWPSSTPSGPPRPPPPATTATATSSPPRSRPATASPCPTRPAGSTAPCTPPNSPPGPRRGHHHRHRRPRPGRSPRHRRRPGRPHPPPRPPPAPPAHKTLGPNGCPTCPTQTITPTWPRSPP